MKYFLPFVFILIMSATCLAQQMDASMTAGEVVERMKENLTCSWATDRQVAVVFILTGRKA